MSKNEKSNLPWRGLIIEPSRVSFFQKKFLGWGSHWTLTQKILYSKFIFDCIEMLFMHGVPMNLKLMNM